MDFMEFKEKVSNKFSLNLSGYKEKQLKRRIEHLMNSQGYTDYAKYFQILITDNQQKDKFLDKLTINVSEFFRNKEIFSKLENEIFPRLLKENKNLKVWSAGSSNGSEAYSMAIILDELTPNTKHTIHATDLDDRILQAAREAEYRQDLLKNVTPKRLENYFVNSGNMYQLKDNIKNKVKFQKHDLLKDRFDKNYDLIVCRNVTIYFTRETQNNLYENFKDALRRGGILFIGATESILNYSQIGLEKISPWFYQKP